MQYPVTPDGRYFVVRGRLWRCTDPGLAKDTRERLTKELMSARRAKQAAMRLADGVGREAARARIDAAKIALGERGPVWWDDGSPDLNRKMARTTGHAAWFDALQCDGSPASGPGETAPEGRLSGPLCAAP